MGFNICGIGVGEGGGRISMAMVEDGVNIGAINTNTGDLAGLKEIPDSKKLLIEISGGGSGKDPNFVRDSVRTPEIRSKIVRFIKNILITTPVYANCTKCDAKEKIKDTEGIGDNHSCTNCGDTFGITEVHKEKEQTHDYLFLFACLGGGSGSGLVGEVVDICVKSRSINIPIAVICTLPDDSEDITTKRNAVSVFKTLYNEYATKEIISPLILIDNQRMQEMTDVPIGSMYSAINRNITGLIERFNSFSNQTSEFMSTIDTMDTARLWALGGCCSIGRFIVGKSKQPRNAGALMVEHPLALDEIEEALKESTFVNGFDLSSAKGVGIIAVAPKHFMNDENVSKSIRYAFGKVSEIVGEGSLVFRGQYNSDSTDCLEFYIFYNGLMYPEARFDQMWEEIKSGLTIANKKRNRIEEFGYDITMDSHDRGENFKKLQNLKNRAVTDEEEDEFVDTRKIEEKPKKRGVACTNCFQDPIKHVSMGVYNKRTGTQPFKGMCPICKGKGKNYV